MDSVAALYHAKEEHEVVGALSFDYGSKHNHKEIPFAAHHCERQWHPTQKIKRLPDGEMELSMTLGGLEEVERWILSWGEHARVLEPVSLKRQLRRVAEAILAAT